jgi:2-polyprenyl-6-methoxyphenol hydroxylase-like FAD-dependent oxidoreductase
VTRILVIGGGIAGATLALFLRRAGLPVAVREARPGPGTDEGSLFNLAPNGLDVLGQLGLLDAVRAAGTDTDRIAFLDHTGRELGVNQVPTVLIRRSALAAVLHDALLAAGADVRYGRRLMRLRTAAEHVEAGFADGAGERADVVVGCDGIRSAVRAAVLPGAGEPEFTGVVDSGGVADPLPGEARADGVLRLTFGRRAFFGYQTLPDGRVAWFQNAPHPTGVSRRDLEALTRDEWRERLLELHEGDHAPIQDLIRATPGPIARWPVDEVAALETWHRGRVCVIGDAAHAMGPHDGQGASMALEDALELARALRDLPDPASAFAAFEAARRPRVADVVRRTRKTGATKFPADERARALRDRLLPMLLARGIDTAQSATEHRIRWDEPPARPADRTPEHA